MDGDDNLINYKVQANGIDLELNDDSRKALDSDGAEEDSFNIRVKDNDEYGYLKVRAQAIDLRSCTHGGIALQPKGYDSDGHMNKVKFEHGGGDGLEFGTFNTEKSSLFTVEYRYNKDGLVRMAERTKEQRSADDSKWDTADDTTEYTYVKQDDDFYDKVYDEAGASYTVDSTESMNAYTTWGDIIDTVNALNTDGRFSTRITSKGNLEIASLPQYEWKQLDAAPTDQSPVTELASTSRTLTRTDGTIKEIGGYKASDYAGEVLLVGETYYESAEIEDSTGNINVESGKNLKLEADGKTEMSSGKSLSVTAASGVSIDAGTGYVHFTSSATDHYGVVFDTGSVWECFNSPIEVKITNPTDEELTDLGLYSFSIDASGEITVNTEDNNTLAAGETKCVCQTNWHDILLAIYYAQNKSNS